MCADWAPFVGGSDLPVTVTRMFLQHHVALTFCVFYAYLHFTQVKKVLIIFGITSTVALQPLMALMMYVCF